MSRAKSHVPPLAAIVSTACVARLASRASSLARFFGRNHSAVIVRYARWSGSSMWISVRSSSPCSWRWASPACVVTTGRGAFSHSLLCSSTSSTSACFVRTWNGRKSSLSTRCTGSSCAQHPARLVEPGLVGIGRGRHEDEPCLVRRQSIRRRGHAPMLAYDRRGARTVPLRPADEATSAIRSPSPPKPVEADELGYEELYSYDHLGAVDPFVPMVAAAAAAPAMRVGPLVLNNELHHPGAAGPHGGHRRRDDRRSPGARHRHRATPRTSTTRWGWRSTTPPRGCDASPSRSPSCAASSTRTRRRSTASSTTSPSSRSASAPPRRTCRSSSVVTVGASSPSPRSTPTSSSSPG